MAHNPSPVATPSNQIRVLLIEDSTDDAHAIDRRLHASRDFHFKVSHVEELEDAQRLITACYFDAAILKKADPDLAVVVLTERPSLSLQRAALDAGIQEFVIKEDDFRPTLEDSLWHAIQRQSLIV